MRRPRRVIERDTRHAFAALMALIFAAGPEPVDASAAVSIALDLGKRALDLRDAGRVVLLLLFEREDVAVLDTRGFL